MSRIVSTTGRLTVVIIALVIGSVLLLLATLGAIPALTRPFMDNWSGTAGLSTPRMPFIDSWAQVAKDQSDQYSGIQISSPDPLVASRTLDAASNGLGSLIAIVGSLVIVLLASRLLMRRSFSRIARWGLVLLGSLIIIAAAVQPQLDALSVDLAVQELGYPIFGEADLMMTENSPEKVVLNLWEGISVLGRVDLTSVLIGIVLVLLGLVVGDGLRLQRDTDGLV